MIVFIAGVITGVLLALISAYYLERNTKGGPAEESSITTDGLNDTENQDPDAQAEKELQERLEKQFKNMMAYTGKRQV